MVTAVHALRILVLWNTVNYFDQLDYSISTILYNNGDLPHAKSLTKKNLPKYPHYIVITNVT